MAELTTVMVRQYHDNLTHLLFQRGGTLRQYVRNETQNSEKNFYEQIGSVVAEQVTTRFAESPVANTPFDRRMVTLTPYHVGDFIDKFERVQTLVDPSSAIVENFVQALGRESDKTIYNAMFGSASTGKEGTTAETFSTTASTTAGGQVITVDFGTANSGLILAKLIEAHRVAEALFWDMNDALYIIVNSAGKSDLLNTTQVTSADYNTVKTLVSGEVDSFVGFKFVNYEGYIPTGSSTNIMQGVSGVASEVIYMYPVFQKGSVLYATGLEPETHIVLRPDRSFHWYAYARMMCGATRMEAQRVLKIERYISG